MKRILIVSLYLILILKTQSQTFIKGVGGSGGDMGAAVAIDAAGNTYTTGYFFGTVDFDPGPGIANLTSAGESDAFILKLDTKGSFLWAKAIGGKKNDEGHSIAVDSLGNIYIMGEFLDTIDADPGTAKYDLYSGGGFDLFFLKLNAAGNFLWANNIHNAYAWTNTMCIDKIGNLYVTGSFLFTVDFDPNPVTSYYLTSNPSQDAFVLKLDTNGNFVWAKVLGGTGGENGYSIVTDAAGNVYTVGTFTFTADFDPGPGVYELSASNQGIFISKLDADGNFVWAKTIGNSSSSSAQSATLDASGNLLITGYFRSYMDFDPGSAVVYLQTSSSDDVFVLKLNADGKYLWAKAMGGYYVDRGDNITTDTANNIYTTGRFHDGFADFDPGAGTVILKGAGESDMFISKLDSNGKYVWARKFGGTGEDIGYSIVTDSKGYIYLTGQYTGPASFDAAAGNATLQGNGYEDVFICKFNSDGLIQNNWTGAADTEWSNALNWGMGFVPDINTHVVINAGVTNYPVLNADGFCKSLTVKPGATINVNTNYKLSIAK